MENDPNRTISELEGAVLIEVERLGPCTAYQIRQGFKGSPTPEWSASAGSIYPAIKRMVRRGWLVSSPREGDGRATQYLSLTAAGKQALSRWADDLDRATSPGQDPFRLRISHWLRLDKQERQKRFLQLEQTIRQRLKAHEQFAESANIEVQIRAVFIRELQLARLKWLSDQEE